MDLMIVKLLLVVHLTGVVIVAAQQRVPGALLELDFVRDECLSGLFSNSGSAEVELNRREGSCPAFNGLTAKQAISRGAVSASPVTALLDDLEDSPAMTFSFWVLPHAAKELPQYTGTIATSLMRFDYEDETSCGYSMDILDVVDHNEGSRQLVTGFCQNDGSMFTQQVESITYVNQSDEWSMRFVVVSYLFTERSYPGLGTVNSIYTNSSYDALVSSTRRREVHTVNRDSNHPSHFQSMSAPQLVLLSPQSSDATWEGHLLHLSLYPFLLSDEQIKQNYLSGVRNSVPVSWNITVQVKEDQFSNISLPVMDADNQEWHANFQLNCVNSSGAEVPNNFSKICNKMIVRVAKQPHYGQLYVVDKSTDEYQLLGNDSTVIFTDKDSSATKMSTPSVSGNGNYVVYYKPLLNKYSATNMEIFDTFTVVAEDGWTADVSEESTVSIIVIPVNDIPVAVNDSVLIYAGQCLSLPVLKGLDIADLTAGNSSHLHYNIDRAVILTLPQNGTLHQVLPNNTLDSDPIRNLSVGGVELMTPFTVGYCFEAEENSILYTLSSGAAVIGKDQFSFGVVDSFNMPSNPGFVGLEILSRLESIREADIPLAAADFSENPIEGQLSNLTLFGRVHSASNFGAGRTTEVLTVRIEEVPSQGVLIDLTTGQHIVSGDLMLTSPMIPLENYPGYYYLVIGFVPDVGIFTQPNVTWYGEGLTTNTSYITFSVVSLTDEKAIGALSGSMSQPIEIRNRNDATPFEFSFQSEENEAQGYFNVYAWGVTAGSIKGRRGSRSQGSTANTDNTTGHATYRSTTVRLGNISTEAYIEMNDCFRLTDGDKGTDIIRAHVVSTNGKGLITLNTQHLKGVDFNSQTYCSSSGDWHCLGDGYNNVEMSFVGTPENISRALNGLQYLSLRPHHTDKINISLYDGASGSCLDEFVLSNRWDSAVTSYRNNECYVTSVSVEVRVLGFYQYIGDDDDNFLSGSSTGVQALWLTRIYQTCVVIVLLGLFYCVFTSCIKCFKRILCVKKSADDSSCGHKKADVMTGHEVQWMIADNAGEERKSDIDHLEVDGYDMSDNSRGIRNSGHTTSKNSHDNV